jgi:hypothetical protein
VTRLREAALAYARKGWPVFPCKPGEKVPATKNGVKDATCDLTQVQAWWDRMPDANIGLATGAPSGLWIVDIDGDEGLDAFCDLDHGVPGTLTAHTPSGGYHLAFLDPGGLGNTASKIAPKVDTRGTGGYIVAAPSVHPNGGRYRWGAKQAPEQPPGWLMRLVREAPKDTPLPVLTRSDLADGYVRAAVDAEVGNVASALEGCRNDTLNRAGWNLGTLVGAGLLDREHAYTALEQAAQAVGLPGGEIVNTLGRALDDGAKSPRVVAA